MISIAEEPLARRIAAIVAERRPANFGARRIAAVVACSAALALAVACTTTLDSAAPKSGSAAAMNATPEKMA